MSGQFQCPVCHLYYPHDESYHHWLEHHSRGEKYEKIPSQRILPSETHG